MRRKLTMEDERGLNVLRICWSELERVVKASATEISTGGSCGCDSSGSGCCCDLII